MRVGMRAGVGIDGLLPTVATPAPWRRRHAQQQARINLIKPKAVVLLVGGCRGECSVSMYQVIIATMSIKLPHLSPFTQQELVTNGAPLKTTRHTTCSLALKY